MVRPVRVRGTSGATATLDVDDDATVGDVAALIESVFPDAPMARQLWRMGFPPKPLYNLKSSEPFILDAQEILAVSCAPTEANATVNFAEEGAEEGIQQEGGKGESEAGMEIDLGVNATDMPPDIAEPPVSDSEGTIVRRVIDADDSCLFNSIGYVLLDRSRREAPKLRQQIADAVLADPESYTEAFLGQAPKEYVAFIKRNGAWGGEIELSIFSKLYRTEIAAFDIIRNRCNIYGQGENFKQRVFVIYDGIHYDALAFTFDAGLPEEMDTTLFSPRDDLALAKAQAIAKEAHDKKSYTDTSSFTLRCLVCQQGLIGQKGAQEHAMQTGHANFAEFR